MKKAEKVLTFVGEESKVPVKEEKKLSERSLNIKELQSMSLKDKIALYKNNIPINARILIEPLIEEEVNNSKVILSPELATQQAQEREYSTLAQTVIAVDPELFAKFKIDIKPGDKVLGVRKVMQYKLNGYFIDEVLAHELTMIIKHA